MIKKVLSILLVLTLSLGGTAWGQEIYDVATGMEKAIEIINLGDLPSRGIDGTGVKVAVIDTGIDVSHPDLQLTPSGAPKVVDFADFTEEGLVTTKPIKVTADGLVLIEGKEYDVAGITSKSGTFHVGILREGQLDLRGSLLRDLNRNGKSDDVFAVLVTDSLLPGIYDTVYVDSNGNYRLSDEKGLKLFCKGLQWGNFYGRTAGSSKARGSSFVISHVERDGSRVKISFDGNGHGTHVSGIIGANGRVTGVAPGVQIIAIKALGSSGDGDWKDIFQAVEYARSQGADIINISIETMTSSWKEQQELIALMKKLSRDRKTLIVLAAGNQGPGISTATDVGGHGNVMTVGAYASPDMWDINYGATVPHDTLLYDTGVGPNGDGTLAPTLVAPAMVTSTVPVWDTGGYYMMDGTSMAAPFVSASAALLIQGARAEGIDASAKAIKRALELGARPIEGYHHLEQGNGLLDISKAWEILKQRKLELEEEDIAVQLKGEAGYVGGILQREELWGISELSVTNLSNNLQDLVLTSDAPWVIPDSSSLLLPRGKPSDLILSYAFPDTPGLYTARVTGTPKAFEGSKMEFLTTAVVPYDLSKEGMLEIQGELGPSLWKRYYFKVNPGIARLDFKFSILPQEEALGRGLLYIYDPSGRRVYQGYAGADYMAPRNSVNPIIDKPEQGIWEAVVVSDYNLSHFGAEKTLYRLQVTTLGATTAEGEYVAMSARAGSHSFSQEIRLKNGGEEFTGQVKAFGLADSSEPYISETIAVRQGEFAQGPAITVGEDALRLEVNIEPDAMESGDVDLYLYRRDTTTGQYKEISSSTKSDTMVERMEILRPLPGEYIVFIDGFSLPQGIANLKVNYRVQRDRKHLQVQDLPSIRKTGELWTVNLDVKVPTSGSDFLGYLAIVDERGVEISYIPIELSVGKKELSIAVDAGTIAVAEKETQNPVETTVVVNGIKYISKGGVVSLPQGMTIHTVEIYDPQYSYLQWRSIP